MHVKAGVRPLVVASLCALIALAGIGPVEAATSPWSPAPVLATSPPLVTSAPAPPAGPSSMVRLSVVSRAGFGVLSAQRGALDAVHQGGVGSAELAGPARPSGRAFQLQVPASRVALTLALLHADASVVSAERVHPLSLLEVPNDSLYGTDQRTYLSALDLPKAWDVTHGSKSVRVAVIDSGATTSHPDLSGKVVGRYNAVTGSGTVTDSDGHGTMVASMIAANTDNGQGMAGSGWDTDLLVVRVMDSHGTINDADVAEGIDWAVAHDAAVINLSLGGAAVGTALKTAIAHAVHANVVVVAAAGNNGTTAKFYPAALPGVLAVGATSPGGGSRASFSQHGSWVDVAAPGVDILGASRTGSGYQAGDGTSFASPLVAGVAALIRASRPSLSAAAVISTLTATASSAKLGFAHGRVDAFKALGYHLVLPGPTVDSPLSGDTVGSTITVKVTVPGSLDADHVRASIVGRGASVTAAVSGGVATIVVPSWGSAGAGTLRVVACRASLCSSSGTDVPLTVDYATPTLTAPSAGDSELADWTASATSASPAVRFLSDGSTVLATDTSAPFSATIPLAKVSSGTHTITAVACDPSGTVCDAGHSSPAVSVDVTHLAPTITALTPSPFSPNADGVLDRATVHYTLDAASDVTIKVTDVHGVVVRTVALGMQSGGAHTWVWDGKKAAGAKAATGVYTVHLETSAVVGLETHTGTAARTVHLDITPPALTSVRTTYSTVFPHRDGYRDATVFSAHLSETAKVTVMVTKVTGATVWSAKLTRNGGGTVRATWRGTSAAGHPVAAGHYRFRFIATDAAGNVTKGAQHAIVVSSRKAASRTWKKNVSARTASGGRFQSTDTTDATYVQLNDAFGTGALRFHAAPGKKVRTLNTVTLHSALAYRSVRIDAYGKGVSGGRAFLAFIDDANSEVHGSALSSSRGTHRGKAASATTQLLYGHSAQWELVVSDGDTYDVRSFTVTLTYLVLI